MKAMVYAFIDNIKSKPDWSGEILSDGKTPIDRTAKILQKAQHGEIGPKNQVISYGNNLWLFGSQRETARLFAAMRYRVLTIGSKKPRN
jgi:hypothetical protein